jgi:hypothetical protein
MNGLFTYSSSFNLTVLSSNVLSSLQDFGAIPISADGNHKVLYEYMGKLFVDHAGNYTFTLNTDGATEVLINNNIQLSAYGSPLYSTDNTQTIILPTGNADIKIRYHKVASAGTDAKMTLQWRDASSPASSNAIIGCEHLFYEPNIQPRVYTSALFNENSFVENLLEYSLFVNYFGVQTTSFTNNLTNLSPSTDPIEKIYIHNYVANAPIPNLYVPFVCAPSPGGTTVPRGDWVINTSIFDGDINYSELLKTLANENNNNYISQLSDFIKYSRVL